MAEETVAPGMEALMQRQRRTLLPPKRTAASAASPEPAQNEPEQEEAAPAALSASDASPAERRPKSRIKRQPTDKEAEEVSIGDVSILVNLNIRVRRGIDDRLATCAFGLREFGMRNVSKAELVELAVLQGPLPAKASAELAEKLTSFRARYPRP